MWFIDYKQNLDVSIIANVDKKCDSTFPVIIIFSKTNFYNRVMLSANKHG